MSSTRFFRSLVLVGLLSLLTAGLAGAQTTVRRPAPPAPAPAAGLVPLPATVAVVNGKPLTAEAFNVALQDAFARTVFEALLDRRLVFDAAAREGLTLTRAEFDERLKAARSAYPSEAEFQAYLHRQGVTESWWQQGLKTDLLLDKLLARRGTVSDVEIAAAYEKHKDEYVHPARVYLWDFATADLEAAYAIARRLNKGEKMSETAEGLTVGWVTRAQVADPLMRDTAFTLEIGQASNPIQVEGKYHVLYVSEAQPGANRSLEQVRPELLTALREDKGLTRAAVLQSLVREAQIQINWDPLRYLSAEYLALRQTRVQVDGKPVILPRPAYQVGGRLLVPAKPLAMAPRRPSSPGRAKARPLWSRSRAPKSPSPSASRSPWSMARP